MKKVLMVVYNYSRDARPRRESEALIKEGYKIDMICLRDREKGETKQENVHGVNVYRLNLSKSRESKFRYIYLYLNFFTRTLLKLSALHLKEKYDVIHIHNMPDFLVFTAVLPKLMGSKVVLDLHDPSPEIYETKYGLSQKDNLIKFVIWQEKISIRFSNKIITTNIAFLERFVSRSCPEKKISIVMNSPQESIFFNPSNQVKNETENNKFIIMYHGYITSRNGLDIAIEAMELLRDRIPRFEFRIFGRGEFVEPALRLISELKLDGYVNYYGSVPIDEIARRIKEIDLGIIPNKLTPFTNLNFPVRIFEYLCLHKPVIVPRTKGIQDYFGEDEIFYFQPDDKNELSETIFKVYSDPVFTQNTVKKGFEVYRKHRWELQGKDLINVYNGLTSLN